MVRVNLIKFGVENVVDEFDRFKVLCYLLVCGLWYMFIKVGVDVILVEKVFICYKSVKCCKNDFGSRNEIRKIWRILIVIDSIIE